MLERVPATAESTAHLFFRSWERPCRSTRLLDPTFWRNGAEAIDTAPWWPVYLQKVRQVPQTAHAHAHARAHARAHAHADRLTIPATPSHWSKDKTVTTKEKAPSPSSHSSTRPYTVSSSNRLKPATSKVYSVLDVEEEQGDQPSVGNVSDNTAYADQQPRQNYTPRAQVHQQGAQQDSQHPNQHSTPDQRKSVPLPPPAESLDENSQHADLDVHSPFTSLASPAPVVTKTSHPAAAEKPTLEHLLHTGNHKEKAFAELLMSKDSVTPQQLDEAWTLFVSLDNQEHLAPDLLSFLVHSTLPRHLSRARETFRLIPRQERSKPIYEAVIGIELRRFQHREAMNLAFEAATRDVHVLSDLMSHFVKNLLWKSAAELIFRNQSARKDMALLLPSATRLLPLEMPTLTQLIHKCAQITDLYLKVLALTKRLETGDPTFIEHRDILDTLCKDLSLLCVQTPKIMSTIPASGLLALLDLQKDAGNWNLHKEALHTILNLPNRKDKADLALMTYRNLRFAFRHEYIPNWVLGSLIGICGDATYPVHIYDYLLDQFEELKGRPDEMAFQRVLTNCANQADPAAVERHLSKYLQLYKKPQNITWLSPLIYVYAIVGDAVNARKQFDRIQQEFGFVPNAPCWNMLLLAHARSTNNISTFDVFNEMKQNNIRLGPYTYGTLLSVCNAQGDLEAALEILADARNEGSSITVPMVNTLIEIYLSHDDYPTALKFALAVSESGTRESLTRTWTSLLRFSAAKGDINSILRTRKLMLEHNVKADEMTYAAILTALTSCQRTAEAVDTLRQMHHEQGLAVTPIHYAIILHGFVVENNRDMATVIYNEMKRRHPTLSVRANQAMLHLQSQRDDAAGLQRSGSLDFIMAILSDLYSSDTSLSQLQLPGPPKRRPAIATLYFDTLLESMIRSKAFAQAKHLVGYLESTMNQRQDPQQSMKFLLAKMDIAIAAHDQDTVREVWLQLFEIAVERFQPVKSNRRQAPEQSGEVDEDSHQTQTSSAVSKPWRFALSKPLTRYMEAMTREEQQVEMLEFLREKFEPAGFQLTGINRNKLIQCLCRSRRPAHHVHAFQMTEELMFSRAQSWRLLQRGLLRQKTTSFVVEAISNQNSSTPRSVTRKERGYTETNRMNELRVHPNRNIPTYTTLVHLSAVLQYAAAKAETGYHRTIKEISEKANSTKRFLQQMPKISDRLQGEILRGLERRADPVRRPRSEESFRQKVDAAGILGGQSPLDHLPSEFLEDIDQVIRHTNDLRTILKKATHTFQERLKDEELHDLGLAEQMTGQILRSPMVLAAKGRFETEEEMNRRIVKQEREKIMTLEEIRRELSARRLTGEVHQREFDSPLGSPVEVDDEGGAVRDTSTTPPRDTQDSGSDAQLSHLTNLNGLPSATSLATSISHLKLVDAENSHSPVHKPLPVSEQLSMLSIQKEQRSCDPSSRPKKEKSQLALPYAATRRIKRRRALKQRAETAEEMAPYVESGRLSLRALMPRTKAARLHVLFEQAQRRRAAYLQYEADLKAGKRLPPFPSTKEGWRRRRRLQGVIRVRFVADLNRNPQRYAIRSGRVMVPNRPSFTHADLEKLISAREHKEAKGKTKATTPVQIGSLIEPGPGRQEGGRFFPFF